MCIDCGCQEANSHHFHQHNHSEEKNSTRKIQVGTDILAKNNHLAHHNQHWFQDNQVVAINLMSSPGTGKTALLEYTLTALKDRLKMAVLVGDQQTDHDAQRLKASGGTALQIATHSSCHLDASMIHQHLGEFVSPELEILFIENVGNLVCPSAFDLGENLRVALLSVTEGEDKPVKYPVLFNKADLIIITKADLIPHLDWDYDKCVDYIRQVNPSAQIITLSTKSGENLNLWTKYLISKEASHVSGPTH